MTPEKSQISNSQVNFAISYCDKSPDAKVVSIKAGGSVNSILKCYDDEKFDNPLTTRINLMVLEEHGKYCFVVYDIEDFYGKNPEEKDFIKKSCFLINLTDNNRVVEKFSYVVRKVSRFQIEAKFINRNVRETFLLVKLVSCINDLDPYNVKALDWTDFETSVKVFGPITGQSLNLPLFDEFKIMGEALNEGMCTTNDFYFGSLMQECNKLYDKEQLNVVKARRYDVRFNLCDLFDTKKTCAKVQSYSLNEFLEYEETLSGKFTFIDLRHMRSGNFLLIYSKEGAVADDRLG